MAKYAFRRKKGNIGEAFVQYILSDFCLVHKIDGSKDIGNDMICELIRGESPTNILFYVQVKYWDTKTPTILLPNSERLRRSGQKVLDTQGGVQHLSLASLVPSFAGNQNALTA